MVMAQIWCMLCIYVLSICHVKGSLVDLLDHYQSPRFADRSTNPDESRSGMHHHGGVQMGVKNDICDNGEDYLEVDWDPKADDAYRAYTCRGNRIKAENLEENTKSFCEKKYKDPIHKCMYQRIVYKERIPLSGPHRPLWPVYGEYTYIPPQRWVHAMEHGAAVFLYHPCADPADVDLLRQTVTGCLRRHIITPYNRLSRAQPFAIVTWGCKLTIGALTDKAIGAVIDFIKKKAIRHELPEWRVFRDGQYNKTLIHKSNKVTNLSDSKLCPFYN